MKKHIGLITLLFLLMTWCIGLGDVYEDFEYVIQKGIATITKYTGSAIEVDIPESINGYPVIIIGSCSFKDCTSLISVTIPDSVTNIGYSAFSKCINLNSISLPKSITYIGQSAFMNCSNLASSISIPVGVTSIEEYTFYGCSSLSSISIPDTITSIGNAAFYNCSNLTSISIPSTVTSIGTHAFYGCSSLSSPISIPRGVNAIQEHTFDGCSSLSSITISDSVTYISDWAFSNCSSLISISIPDTVTSIGNNAFTGCFNLSSPIDIPSGVTSIGNFAFSDCSSLTSVSIPDTVASIGNSAFYHCSNLTSISIPAGVSAIEDHTFNSCSSLVSVSIPESVTSIGEWAFFNCTRLTSLNLPSGLISIGKNAFSCCSGLASLTLPSGILNIGSFAFSNCTSLTSLSIPDSITALEDYTFNCCIRLTEVSLPDHITSIGNYPFGNLTEKMRFYCVYNSDTAKILSKTYSFTDTQYPGLRLRYQYDNDTIIGFSVLDADKNIVDAVIPDTITAIGTRAFYECTKLLSITVSESLTSIGDSAFRGCTHLESICIPSSVTSIGSAAFSGCSSLSAVSIPDGISTINSSTFDMCSNLSSVSLPNSITIIDDSAFSNCKSLKTIDLPDNLRTIGSYAFSNSGLKAVSLPESVQSIGATAFSIYNSEDPFCIYIPDGVKEIGTAPLSWNAVIYCHEYSYVESWAHTNGKKYTVILLSDNSFDQVGRIDMDEVSLITNGHRFDLHINVFPSYSGLDISYTSSDPGILSVDEKGCVTGNRNGTADLIVTAGNLTVRKTLKVVTPASDFQLADIYVPAKGTQTIEVSGITPSEATLSLRWETADPVIANIDNNGLLNGYVIGSTTYSAIDTLTGLRRSATVYIIGPINKIEFDQAVLNLYPLQSTQLAVTATSGSYTFHNQAMTYSSSDEAIATVDEKGFVTAHQSGTVIITAKSVIGNASATCQVHVIQAATMNIPNGTTVIRDNAFKGTAAEVYVIPDSVTSIGAHAFADLPNAKLIVLPKEVDVDPTAFEGTTAEISQ